MRSSYKKIGSFIKQVNIRNKDLATKNLQGISINKFFMPSVANITGTDLSKYKVVAHKQFAFNPMHVGRDEVLPISMLKDEESVIVSPAYVVFKVKDENELLPEYLMMWCMRAEFDRNAWFTTDSSVRGGFGWKDFCDLPLPVPEVEKQREIIREYHAIVDRIKLNELLNQKLEETAQTIYKQWFVDFEFPISKEYATEINKPELEGKPYKSSGCIMTWNDELEQEIPEEWNAVNLGEITNIKAGGDCPKEVSNVQTASYTVPIYSNSTIDGGLFGYTNKAKVSEKSVTISARGGIGYTALRLIPYVPIVRLIVVIPKVKEQLSYLYQCVKNFNFNDIASAQAQLTIPDISSFWLVNPDEKVILQYSQISMKLIKHGESIKQEISHLQNLQRILLSQMTKTEAVA